MNPQKEELLNLERSYWQAIKERDGSVITKLTDDGCVVAGAQGVAKLDRSTIAAMTSKPTYQLKEFRLTDEVVRMLGDDVAVVAYKVHEDLVVDGKSVSIDAADSSTWVKRDGEWVCAAHTESLKGDPTARSQFRAEIASSSRAWGFVARKRLARRT